MTSKEYIEEELKLDDNHFTSYERTMLEKVLKDLEVLEEIRNTFKVEKEETINQNRYWLIVKKKPYYSYMITKEQYEKWLRWLNNDR